MHLGRTLQQRLLSRVESQIGGCWFWTGYRTRQGYGIIGVAGRKNEGAHRVSYRLFVGDIPLSLSVCHHCDNPSCVNPAHLFVGTNRDNVADRERKGRQFYRKLGAHNGRARLTSAQVVAIHDDPRKQDDIALAFGVSQSTVHRIKAGAAGGWRHLGLAPKRTFSRRQQDEYLKAKESAAKQAARKAKREAA